MGKRYDDLYYGEGFLRRTITLANDRLKRLISKSTKDDVNKGFYTIYVAFTGNEELIPSFYRYLEPTSLYDYYKYVYSIIDKLNRGDNFEHAVYSSAPAADLRKIRYYSKPIGNTALSVENLENGKRALIKYLAETGKDDFIIRGKDGSERINYDFKFRAEDAVKREAIEHDNNIAMKKVAKQRVKENKMKGPTQLTLDQAEQKFANKTFTELTEMDEEDEYDNPQMFTEEGYPLREKRKRWGVEYYTEFDPKRPYHGMIYDEERNICKEI
ncbi:MAG: hypothetical protein K6F08_00755 [bacterium]|nr:hypothetical protein [bacterium]